MSRTMSAAIGATLLGPLQAFAHEGHGIPGASHWHATDTLGLLLLGALVALAIWLNRGGK